MNELKWWSGNAGEIGYSKTGKRKYGVMFKSETEFESGYIVRHGNQYVGLGTYTILEDARLACLMDYQESQVIPDAIPN